MVISFLSIISKQLQIKQWPSFVLGTRDKEKKRMERGSLGSWVQEPSLVKEVTFFWGGLQLSYL